MSQTAENIRALLQRWLDRTERSQQLHYKAADESARNSRIVGVLGIGSGILIALSSLYPPTLATAASVLFGVGAAFASAAQMLFKWADSAEGHKSAGVQLGQIRRNIEQALACPEALTQSSVDAINEQINLVIHHVPRIPFDFYTNEPRPISLSKGDAEK